MIALHGRCSSMTTALVVRNTFFAPIRHIRLVLSNPSYFLCLPSKKLYIEMNIGVEQPQYISIGSQLHPLELKNYNLDIITL